jgi:hypothetical protein
MDIGAAPMDISETPMAVAEPPTRFGEARNSSHEVATACSPGRQPGVEENPKDPSPDGATDGRGA